MGSSTKIQSSKVVKETKGKTKQENKKENKEIKKSKPKTKNENKENKKSKPKTIKENKENKPKTVKENNENNKVKKNNEEKVSVEEKERQIVLKNYIDPLVRRCVSNHYSTGPIGYIIMVGGEALNHHLSPGKRVITSDYDLKFVVTPSFTDSDENLRRANVRRLYMLKDLFTCLKSVEVPDGYYEFYPRMSVLFKDVVQDLDIDGHKVTMVNPITGQRTPFVYRFNKVFTIKMVYRVTKTSPLVEFTLIDLGLYYRLPQTEPYYNFLSKTIYDTFLKKPFSKPIPMPYVVDHNKIRYPTLKYILVDTFRMILFANDFLEVYKDNQAKVDFFTGKLAGYNRKLKLILSHVIEKNPDQERLVEQITKQMERTIETYVPLIPLNALCFREKDRANFVAELQDKNSECNQEYLDDLKTFHDQYYKTLETIQQIRSA